jgi:hypothetical protein
MKMLVVSKLKGIGQKTVSKKRHCLYNIKPKLINRRFGKPNDLI